MTRRYADIHFSGSVMRYPDGTVDAEPPETITAEEQARDDWLDEFPVDSLDGGDES